MNDEFPTDRLLHTKHVRARFNVCDRTLDRWIADAKMGFPQPIRINGRRYYRLAEIDAFERSRAAERVA